MKAHICPVFKAHLIRGAFYVLLLLAVFVITLALVQRSTGERITSGNMPLADANDSSTRSFNPVLNGQPIAGCGFTESFDNVTPPVLPPGWVAINAINPDGIFWQTSDSGNPSPPAHSLPNAAWVNDPDTISDKYLDSPSGTIDPLSSADLHFSNNYALEDTFDGGVLEISVDGGPFQDILAAGGSFARGGYNGTISACCGNPLAGRQAWTGNSGGFIDTDVDLTAFGGHTIALRWRMASDSSGSDEGWRVDDIFFLCERPTPTPTAAITPTPTATVPPSPTPTPSEAPCAAFDSQPACNSTVFTQLTDFIVYITGFVSSLPPPSVFTVNGIPADSVSGGGSTIEFHFNASPVIPGQNTMDIPPGAFTCSNSGRPFEGFHCTFTYQPSTPTPTPRPSPTPRLIPSPRSRPTPEPRP